MTPLARRTLAAASLCAVLAGCDGGGGGSTPPPATGAPPLVNAGPDQTVNRGAGVTLAGTAVDPEGLPVTYAWAQTAGPAVTLSNPTSSSTSFAAPAVACDLEFALTASDGGRSASDRVTVHVANRAPVVTALAIAPAVARTLDDLTATAATSDPDGDPVTLAWAWTRNGTALPAHTTATLPASETTKGDVIRVTVTARDGAAQATRQASVTIQDTPPLFSSAPPSTVTHGQAVSFQIVAEDPDGDPVGGFSLAHGPAGMTVGAGGLVSWTAALPMLDVEMDVRWAVSVAGANAASLSGVFHVVDPDHATLVRRTGIEIPVADAGMAVTDLDGDGDVEVLVGSPSGVYVLERAGAAYAQTWMYPFSPGVEDTVAAVAAADVDGAPGQEIFFSTGDLLVKLDGATRREVARLDAADAFFCRDLEIADLDRDGSPELVCLGMAWTFSDTGSVVVLDPATLQVEWQTAPLTPGLTLAVGDVDLDAALEIVTAGGHVLDGATHAIQWTYSAAFGAYVDTGDLDGDGVEEIVGALSWDAFRGYSATLRSALWEIATFDNDALLVADVDADGKAEILVGDGQGGDVTAYDYVGGASPLSVQWSIDTQASGVTSIGAGDVDGDGALEFVWGAGSGSSGKDLLVVAGRNPAIGVEWTNVNPSELEPPFVGGRLARLGGGASAVLFAVSNTDSDYAGTRLVALDPATGLLSFSAELGTNAERRVALDVVDYDGDAVDEAFLATASTYDGYFTVRDFAAGAAEWTSAANVGNGVAATHADLNGDGSADLVAIDTDGYVHAYDVKGKALLWKSPGLGGYGVDVDAGDVDGDGEPEIVAASSTRAVVFGKHATYGFVEEASIALPSVPADLLVARLAGEAVPAIYVLQAMYPVTTLVRLDGALVPVRSIDLGVGAALLALEDLPSARNLVVGFGSNYSGGGPDYLQAIDAATGAEIWRSPPLWGPAQRNSLSYVDTDADGAREIAFGTSRSMYLTR